MKYKKTLKTMKRHCYLLDSIMNNWNSIKDALWDFYINDEMSESTIAYMITNRRAATEFKNKLCSKKEKNRFVKTAILSEDKWITRWSRENNVSMEDLKKVASIIHNDTLCTKKYFSLCKFFPIVNTKHCFKVYIEPKLSYDMYLIMEFLEIKGESIITSSNNVIESIT